MGKPDNRFEVAAAIDAGVQSRVIEIYVTKGFCALELASITHVLATTNTLLGRDLFSWRYSTDKPGIITGDQGALVRAEPAIGDHRLADMMVVIGVDMVAPRPVDATQGAERCVTIGRGNRLYSGDQGTGWARHDALA